MNDRPEILATGGAGFIGSAIVWALSRSARFVYASSAATYGDGAEGMDDRAENLASTGCAP